MANDTTPFGLRYVEQKTGAGSPAIQECFVAASDNTALYIGQLVKYATMVTTGNADNLTTVTAYAATDTQVAGVVVAVDQISGVTMGSENLTRKHRPASTAMRVLVCTDPNAVFEVRCDNGGAALAGADVMENVDVVVGTGSAVTGLSATVVDSSTHANTATLPLRVIGFRRAVDNTPAANDTIARVILNTVPDRTVTGLAL